MKFEPLEIKNAILKELNLEIISDAKGRRFPHPGIEVQLLALEESDQNKLLSALGDNILQGEIHRHLTEPRCLKATPLVEIGFVEETEDAQMKKKEFLLRYIAKTTAAAADAEVFLEIQEGYANRKQMKLVHDETFIGRCQNVANRRGGVERVNDLYFPDAREVRGKIPKALKAAENINISVSRVHAHIKYAGGSYYLFDDGSSRGTTILPAGRGKSESIDRFSGKKLSNNDLISFGEARVKVRIVKKS